MVNFLLTMPAFQTLEMEPQSYCTLFELGISVGSRTKQIFVILGQSYRHSASVEVRGTGN